MASDLDSPLLPNGSSGASFPSGSSRMTLAPMAALGSRPSLYITNNEDKQQQQSMTSSSHRCHREPPSLSKWPTLDITQLRYPVTSTTLLASRGKPLTAWRS